MDSHVPSCSTKKAPPRKYKSLYEEILQAFLRPYPVPSAQPTEAAQSTEAAQPTEAAQSTEAAQPTEAAQASGSAQRPFLLPDGPKYTAACLARAAKCNFALVPNDASRRKIFIISAGVSVSRYASKFLLMPKLQTLKDRKDSLQKTRCLLQHRMKTASDQKPGTFLAVCMSAHWLLQHSVYILYDHDDPKQKRTAIISFPFMVQGPGPAPYFPHLDGDVLIVLRADPADPATLLPALYHAAVGLHNINKLPGTYHQTLVVHLTETRPTICKIHNRVVQSAASIAIPLVFKPLYFPGYFLLEDDILPHHKVIMALELLQKTSILLSNLCHLILAADRPGAALAFAEANWKCTKFMNVLVRSGLLRQRRVYVYFTAHYHLANCFYVLALQGMDLSKHRRDYVNTKAAMGKLTSYFESLQKEKSYAPHFNKIDNKVSLVFKYPSTRARLSMCHFAKLKLPSLWRRSTFRNFHGNFLCLLMELRQTMDGDFLNFEEDSAMFRDTSCSSASSLSLMERDHTFVKIIQALRDTEESVFMIGTERQRNYPCDHIAAVCLLRARTRGFCYKTRAMLLASELVERRQRQVQVAHYFGLSAAVTREECVFFAKMEEQHLACLTAFHCPGLLLEGATQQHYINTCKDILMDHATAQIELEDRGLKEWTLDCTISKLTSTLVHCVLPFTKLDSNSGPRLDLTTPANKEGFFQVMALYFASLTHLYRIKYRQAVSRAERKDCLQNSIYYTRATALLMRLPGAGAAVLSGFSNYAFMTEYCYTVVIPDTVRDAPRQLCILKRMVLLLPFFWEMAIHRGRYTPVHYGEIYFKKISLPFKEESSPSTNGQIISQIETELDGLSAEARFTRSFTGSMDYTPLMMEKLDAIANTFMSLFKMGPFGTPSPSCSVDYCKTWASSVTGYTLDALAIMGGMEDRNVYSWSGCAIKGASSIMKQFLYDTYVRHTFKFEMPDFGVLALVISAFACVFAILFWWRGFDAHRASDFVNLARKAIIFRKDSKLEECPSSEPLNKLIPKCWRKNAKRSLFELYALNSPYNRESPHPELSQGVTVAMNTIVDSLHLMPEKGFSTSSNASVGLSSLMHIFQTIKETGTELDCRGLSKKLAGIIAHALFKTTNFNFDYKESSCTSPHQSKLQVLSTDTYSPLLDKFTTLKTMDVPVPAAEPKPTVLNSPNENKFDLDSYDPLAKVDYFIKKDEVHCPSFSEVLASSNFRQEFDKSLDVESVNDLTVSVSQLIHRTVKNLQPMLMAKADRSNKSYEEFGCERMKISGYKKLVKLDSEFFEKLFTIIDLVTHPHYSCFRVTEALYKIDQLLFGGETAPILRGYLPAVHTGGKRASTLTQDDSSSP